MADRITKFDLFVILIKKKLLLIKILILRKYKQYFLYSEINTVITVRTVCLLIVLIYLFTYIFCVLLFIFLNYVANILYSYYQTIFFISSYLLLLLKYFYS